MSNGRTFRRRHLPPHAEPAQGDPHEAAQATMARLAQQKARRESPGQYRAMQVMGWIFLAMMVGLAVMFAIVLVIGGVRALLGS